MDPVDDIELQVLALCSGRTDPENAIAKAEQTGHFIRELVQLGILDSAELPSILVEFRALSDESE